MVQVEEVLLPLQVEDRVAQEEEEVRLHIKKLLEEDHHLVVQEEMYLETNLEVEDKEDSLDAEEKAALVPLQVLDEEEAPQQEQVQDTGLLMEPQVDLLHQVA